MTQLSEVEIHLPPQTTTTGRADRIARETTGSVEVSPHSEAPSIEQLSQLVIDSSSLDLRALRLAVGAGSAGYFPNWSSSSWAVFEKRLRIGLPFNAAPPARHPFLRGALDRSVDPPPSRLTLARAERVLAEAERVGMAVDRVSVTRSAAVAITFIRVRRYGIFECDSDGDVVLTLTNRANDEEADAYVVAPGQEKAHLEKALSFLEG